MEPFDQALKVIGGVVVNVKILNGTRGHDGQTAFMDASDLAGIECTNSGS